MPHFVIDCSEDVVKTVNEQTLIEAVHQVAVQSSLFTESDIKVRVNSTKLAYVGGQPGTFIHVFTSIMQGRTIEQRAMLSKAVVSKLAQLMPELSNIAMNISEFEKATYCNRAML